jgi:iron uptake system EfeUOB component EfeO/EfeM
MAIVSGPLRRWAPAIVGAVLAAIVGFALWTALGVGGGSGTTPASPNSPAQLSALARYSEQAAIRSGAGNADGAPPAPELVPLPPSAFVRPVDQYRAYAIVQLGAMGRQIAALETALAANDRTASRATWRAAYVDYLHLGAVYGEFGPLDQRIDGSAGGVPGGVSSPQFTGLHRIEHGLWSSASPRSQLVWARGLATNVRALRHVIPTLAITPLDYATRAHEILEDAERDLLSGVDVPWSQEGVLATAAGIQATEEVINTLRPLLDGRENVIEVVDTGLQHLQIVMSQLRREHGGQYPTLAQLTQRQSEVLNGTLGGTLEALSQVPGALETRLPVKIPPLPATKP